LRTWNQSNRDFSRDGADRFVAGFAEAFAADMAEGRWAGFVGAFEVGVADASETDSADAFGAGSGATTAGRSSAVDVGPLTGFAESSGFFEDLTAFCSWGSGLDDTGRTDFSGAGAVTGVASAAWPADETVCIVCGRVGTA
jgi:hypothetical protein